MRLMVAVAIFAFIFLSGAPSLAQSSLQTGSSTALGRVSAQPNAAAQREIDDLQAQKEMAKAADRLVIATWWQIAIGGVSMAGLLWTLAVTRSSSRMQLRAYIVVNIYKLDPVVAGKPSKVLMNIMNVGSTPAYELSSVIKNNIVSRHDASRLACEKITEKIEEALTISPNQGHGVGSESDELVTAGELADIQSGDKVVLVRGTVRYKDIFKRIRHTHFAHVYTGTDPANLLGAYHPLGNYAD